MILAESEHNPQPLVQRLVELGVTTHRTIVVRGQAGVAGVPGSCNTAQTAEQEGSGQPEYQHT
jgi:hypothetical protein